MTHAEEILRAGLEDAEAAFGLLEATLRQEPTADIVMQFRNRANAALERARNAESVPAVAPARQEMMPST